MSEPTDNKQRREKTPKVKKRIAERKNGDDANPDHKRDFNRLLDDIAPQIKPKS